MRVDYYEDRRWCPGCRAYVSYLQGPDQCYCCTCGGGEVRLFDREHWLQVFGERWQRRPPEGGKRPADYPRTG